MLGVCVFWGIALVTVLAAFAAALRKNVLHAAYALGLTLCGVAGLYIFLEAPFLAAVQLLVYAGGVVVLAVFAVMLAGRSAVERSDSGRVNLAPGFISAAAAVLLAIAVLAHALAPSARTVNFDRTTASARAPVGTAASMTSDRQVAPTPAEPSGLRKLGALLLTKYALPFEAATVLLVAALVGAVAIARKPPPDASTDT